MHHPLRQKLATLRTRLRRLLAIHGVCCVVAAAAGAALSLGLLDYLLRVQDFGVRLMFSVTVAAVAGWTAWRYLLRPLRIDWRDVDLARQVERWQPALGDRLRSSVEFLRQAEDDPLAGSPALRRAVIAQTTADAEELDFAAALDPRPVTRAAMVAAVVCLAAATVAALDPRAAALGLKRLALPFSTATWPRETQLTLRREVTRVARGQTFELEIAPAAGTQLPPEVRVHYRWQTGAGAPTEEVDRLPGVGGAVVARRENVTAPFAYRVEGGDDQTMPWIEVALVEPPQIAACEMRIVPPAYSGLKPQKADGQVRALVGSRLEVRASANKPLRTAALRLEDNRVFPARLSGDGLRLEIPAPDGSEVAVEKSGPYWFELTDRDGLDAPAESRGQITAVPDAPPTALVEQPSVNLFVTPEATIRLRALVKDDLAVRRAALVFSRSDQPDEQAGELALYEGPATAPPLAEAAPPPGGREVAVDRTWNLAELGLTPGVQLTFQVMAEDYRDQTGTSEPRRLSIITLRELKDRIGARQATLLAELDRILQMQRSGRGELAGLEAKWEAARQLDEADVHRIQAVELNQRQIDRVLTGRGDGLPSHIHAILADIVNNKIDSDDVGRLMEWLLAEIARVERECLTENARLLTAAVKAAQVQYDEAAASSAPSAAVREGVAAAGKVQEQIIETLERMRMRLAEGDSFRRFDRDLAQLAREQDDLAKRTTEVGRRTLSRPWKELSPTDVAELRVLAGRQADLARRLDRILQEMAHASANLRQTDPLAADTVADACDEAARLGVAGQMRDGALAIQENQIGVALGLEKEIAEGLQDILNILANRRQQALERLVKRLVESEAELTALQKRQAELAARWADAGQAPQRQAALEDEARRLARRLERLSAEKAGACVGGAADAMRGACNAQGNAPEAAAQAQRAAKALDDARRELAARRLQGQAELAVEQMAKLEDAVKHLRTQQEGILQETQRLAALAAQGGLSRGQAASLNDLARRQAALKADVGGLARKFAGAKGFLLALDGIQTPMGAAAARLARRDMAEATQKAQSQAIARLDLLLAALEPESPDGAGGAAGGDQGGQGGQPGGVQSLAELKLLKLLQAELNARTRQLQTAVGDAKPTEEQIQEFRALGQEQQRLFQTTLELIAPGGNQPEESP